MPSSGDLANFKPALTRRAQKLKVRKIANSHVIRICLFLALLAALAVGVVNVVFVKDKINVLVTDRDTQRNGRITAEGERDRTKKELAATKKDLDQSKQDLAASNAERDKAIATATAQTKRADDLSDKLAKTAADRDQAQTELAAYKATGISADQVGKLNTTLKNTREALEVANEEKLVLLHTVTRLTNELAKYHRQRIHRQIARRPPWENPGGGSEI